MLVAVSVNPNKSIVGELSCLRTQFVQVWYVRVVDWIYSVAPHYSTSCRNGVFLLRHPWHSSPALFTAHASVTHVKAPQTDFHVKPDNSSGPTHDSPSEKPLRKKVTFQHRKTPKSIEKSHGSTEGETTTQARKGPTLLNAPYKPGTEAKARRAAPKPRRHPSPCQEPWQKLRSIRSDTMAQLGHASKPSRPGFDRSRLPIPSGWDGPAPDSETASRRGAV